MVFIKASNDLSVIVGIKIQITNNSTSYRRLNIAESNSNVLRHRNIPIYENKRI